ncbi:uncharacterized protein LOC135222171 [Macrobrachium nipponense]|uniref:uncharacterized protein LOC135222171 n=1 Tax=Macrobrachium nipponense TaxID=159736 RepID=UPI0030C873DF
MASRAGLANATSANGNLVQQARYFIETYNATTIAYTGGLALGTVLVILSLFLYYLYKTEQAASSSGSGRSGGQWQYGGGSKSDDKDEGFEAILGLLEKSWVFYGAQEQECRRRLSCEAHLSNATDINEKVSGTLKGLISQVKDGILTSTATPADTDKTAVRDLLLAAKHGRDWNDCQTYNQLCQTVSLASLPQNGDNDQETLVPQSNY